MPADTAEGDVSVSAYASEQVRQRQQPSSLLHHDVVILRAGKWLRDSGLLETRRNAAASDRSAGSMTQQKRLPAWYRRPWHHLSTGPHSLSPSLVLPQAQTRVVRIKLAARKLA
ncbi:unnamed protein product [Pleuronectes platessa]|uniref:Uncharacterized protein n=1 Tax=Pleuronectes platessa TaxID=8262 RepID=A0A9N7VQS8_PLEPL|nr:unnamed protein product [Pleuronectes platessa]